MTLWLPVSESQPHERDAAPASASVRGGDETVLLVEDEAAIRELMRAILTRLGYQVTDAPHPHAALHLAREGHRFDLVISDVVMPGMDGREMVHQLEQIAPGFQVLYVSGFADTKSAGSELHTDAAHFLAKPFTPAGLAQKVRALLDGP